jgi:hypothetical protein
MFVVMYLEFTIRRAAVERICHIRDNHGPDSGLGFLVKSLKTFEVVPSLLEVGQIVQCTEVLRP